MSDRIIVKFSSGAWQTNTIRGQRASSTSSSAIAAAKLAEKLYPRPRLYPGTELYALRYVGQEDTRSVDVYELEGAAP